MSVAARQPEIASTPDLGSLARAFPGWLMRNLRGAIFSAAIGSVTGYLANVWLLIFQYQGTNVPSGAPVPGQGNFVAGSLFWGLASTIIFGIVGYRRAVGRERFWRDLRSLPRVLASLVRRDGTSGRVHLLWGAALSLIASQVISPFLGAVVGMGLMIALPSMLGRVVTSLLMRSWSFVIQRVAPTRGHRTAGAVSMTVGILGASLALVVGLLLPGGPIKLALAAACGGVAFYLGRSGKPVAPIAIIGLLAAGAALIHFLHPWAVFADDGGWVECGSTLSGWLSNCQGAPELLARSTGGAVAAGGFAPAGLFLGSLAGSAPGGFSGSQVLDPPGPAPDSPPPPPDAPPGIPGADEIYSRLSRLSGEIEDPGLYERLHTLFEQMRQHGGAFGPREMAELLQLELAQQGLADQRLGEIRRGQEDAYQRNTQLRIESDARDLAREAAHRDLLARIDKQEEFIRHQLEQLPAGQASKVEDILDRVETPSSPNPEELGRLQRLSTAVFNQTQGQSEGAAAAAQLDAAWAKLGEDAAHNVRTAAQAAEMVLMLPAAGGAAAAQLGAFYLGRNFIEGSVDGYAEGGWRGAVAGAVRRTLPVNTIEAIAEGQGGGRILLSMFQDVGNVLQLRAGAEQIASLVKDQSLARGLSDADALRPRDATDRQWLADRQKGGRLVNELEDVQQRAAAAPKDPALQQELTDKVNQVNADYHAKNFLKQRPREVQDAFNQQLKPVYKSVDEEMVKNLNDRGFEIGGKPITKENFWDVRNATSKTAGMDRDKALWQKRPQILEESLARAAPGSEEAHYLAGRLHEAHADLQPTLKGKPINDAEFNYHAQDAYNDAFHEVTARTDPHGAGYSATESLQTVTHSQHPEAYVDMAVLKNRPAETQFAAQHAEQTGSVTTYKAFGAQEHLTPGKALQETARGTAKDIATKLEPLLVSKGADPAKLADLQRARTLLEHVGEGNMVPSRAQELAHQQFGTSIEGLAHRVDGNLTVATKWHQSGPGLTDAAGRGLRAANPMIDDAAHNDPKTGD